MPRPRQRACLQDGLSLNLNRLTQRGFIRPGAATGPLGIKWMNSYFEEEVASGVITADMSRHEGWFRIQIGQLDQRITLVSCPRRFGGRQWYFICPFMNRRASVLWKPPGARDFVGSGGGGKLPTLHNSMAATAEPIKDKRKSNPASAR